MSSIHVAVHLAAAQVNVSEYDASHTGRPWAAVEIHPDPISSTSRVSLHVDALDQVAALDAALGSGPRAPNQRREGCGLT